MKKEKVMYVDLPKDAEYRKAYVTEDGKVAIEYAEEIAVDTINVSKTVSKAIPQITPLIGGTEVYKKEGTSYWYCRIKNGRDEFMYLYFGDLTVNDLLYDAKGRERKFITEEQRRFKANVINSLQNMPKEGFRWIPVYEPSEDDGGNIQYVSGKYVLVGLNSYTWEEAFQKYSPENGSRMASITTYFLLLLRLLKDGFATIEQLADDSADIGNYRDSYNAKISDDLEKTGERHQLGGLYGFAGNTCKIVKNSESSSGFSILGGFFYTCGYKCPLAQVTHVIAPDSTCSVGVGLLELTK